MSHVTTLAAATHESAGDQCVAMADSSNAAMTSAEARPIWSTKRRRRSQASATENKASSRSSSQSSTTSMSSESRASAPAAIDFDERQPPPGPRGRLAVLVFLVPTRRIDSRDDPFQATDAILVGRVIDVTFGVHCSKICAVTNKL